MRRLRRPQRFDDPELRPRPEVRVPMRARLRAVPELGLDRLDRLARRRGLARDGVTADRVMAQQTQPERALYPFERIAVRVQVRRELAVLREEELLPCVALIDMPANRREHVLGDVERV